MSIRTMGVRRGLFLGDRRFLASLQGTKQSDELCLEIASKATHFRNDEGKLHIFAMTRC